MNQSQPNQQNQNPHNHANFHQSQQQNPNQQQQAPNPPRHKRPATKRTICLKQQKFGYCDFEEEFGHLNYICPYSHSMEEVNAAWSDPNFQDPIPP